MADKLPRGSCRSHAIWLLTLSLLTLGPLVVAGCGGSGTSGAAHANASTTETALATSLNTTPTTSSSAPSTSTGSPELVLCLHEPNSSSQLLALSGGAEGVSVTPLASFAGAGESTACSVSPDMTKLAALSTTPEGSNVAGYYPNGGGAFVNVSGHESNGYSGVSHADGDPLFNPATGELWWSSEGHMWSSALNGATPQERGEGRVEGFAVSGAPSPNSVSSSPDGSVEAYINLQEMEENNREVGLAIGPTHALGVACQNRADKGVYTPAVSQLVSACPGVGSTTFSAEGCHTASTTCEAFIGFISDSEYIVESTPAPSSSGGGERFYRVAFKIDNGQIKVVSRVPITPSTTMTIGWATISPNGESLWYVTKNSNSTYEATEATKLYIVPTHTATSEPSPVSVTPATSLAAASVTGWRSNGHWRPSAP
jgi:hypothetical protein